MPREGVPGIIRGSLCRVNREVVWGGELGQFKPGQGGIVHIPGGDGYLGESVAKRGVKEDGG